MDEKNLENMEVKETCLEMLTNDQLVRLIKEKESDMERLFQNNEDLRKELNDTHRKYQEAFQKQSQDISSYFQKKEDALAQILSGALAQLKMDRGE